MTSFTCAVGFFVLTCNAPDVQVPQARLCETSSVIPYRASTDPELRRRLREHNAAYRAACGDR